MTQRTLLLVLAFCSSQLLLAPASSASNDFLKDLVAHDGIPQMSEEDAEDIRTELNNGRDPDDFEVARESGEPEAAPEQAITTPAQWKELLDKGNQGDPEANYILGLCNAKGHLVPRDLNKAFQRFFAAARKSHFPAMFFTARCLEMKIGIKTPEDEVAAAKIIPQYYGFAAMKGDPHACYHAARYLKYKGNGRYDAEYVSRYFRQATDKGHPAAQYELALCYRNGDGVPKLRKLSFKVLRVSAEQGYSKAQYDLGLCYAAGNYRVPKNLVEAYAWIATAISNGVADESWALENLKNQMTPEDLAKAKQLATDYASKYKAKPAPSNPLL